MIRASASTFSTTLGSSGGGGGGSGGAVSITGTPALGQEWTISFNGGAYDDELDTTNFASASLASLFGVLGGLVTIAGIGLTLVPGLLPVALAGFVLIGLGAANLVPVVFSLAARQPDMAPGLAVAAVTGGRSTGRSGRTSAPSAHSMPTMPSAASSSSAARISRAAPCP